MVLIDDEEDEWMGEEDYKRESRLLHVHNVADDGGFT